LRTYETEHLRLVYWAPAHSFIVPWAARCFENAYRFHAATLGWTPSEKVTVILDDTADYQNAAAWANPRNGILVHLAPANFVYETGPANERVHFAMNHELAHVATLDQATGRDAFFRTLFRGKVRETSEHPETILYGWLTVPRRAAPKWHREGTAVFFETWMAGGLGRAQGPWDEMVFRAMVRDSVPIYDPLGLESEGMKTDFQAGVNAYLYGTRFSTWLANRYTPAQFVDWVSRKPGSRPRYAGQFKNVFGTSLTSAWREWVADEERFQRANLDSIRRYPVTGWRDLSSRPLGSVSRAFVDSAGGVVYGAVFYPGRVASIMAMSLAGGPAKALAEVRGPALYFVSSLAWDPHSRTLFYTTDNDGWRDLCALDPATGRSRRLIKEGRIGDLAFNRADSSLWGVRHFNGISTLVRIPKPWTEWHQVVSFPYGRDVYDLDVSPDGQYLVGSMGEVTGSHALHLWETGRLGAGDTTSRVLQDFGSSIPTNFVFTPDGRAVVGSSCYTGVSNVFRVNLENPTLEILTNAETGFYRPIPIGNDSLIVFRYAGGGFVPAVVEGRPLQDVSAITFFGERTVARHPVLRSWTTPSPATFPIDSLQPREGRYRALGLMRLNSIVPMVEAYKDLPTFGVVANFADPLSIHQFTLGGSYSPHSTVPDDERWHVAADWKHGPWDAKLRWDRASFYDLFGPRKISLKGFGGGVAWSRTLLREAPRQIDLRIGLAGYTGLERLPGNQNVAIGTGYEQILSHDVALTGRNTRSSLGAVDAEKGWKWSLGYAVNGVHFTGGGVDEWRRFPSVDASADLGVPLGLPHASLWLRTAGGWADGARDEPFANFFFGGFGNNWIDYQEVKRYRDPYSFPGAEIDAIAGTRYGKAMLDLNLPPIHFSRFGTPSLYASWLRMSVFTSAVVTNPDAPDWRRKVANVGVQADLRLQLFTAQPLTLSGGYARAFEEDFEPTEEWMISLKIL
jgi:hypothetical protein